MRRQDREAAYVEFVTTRQDRLRRIAYALCGDWHQAEVTELNEAQSTSAGAR